MNLPSNGPSAKTSKPFREHLGLRAVAVHRWKSTCLACKKPWIQSSVTQR